MEIEKIHQYESTHCLFEKNYDSFYYWNYIRFDLIYGIIDPLLNNSEFFHQRKFNLSSSITVALSLFINSLFKWNIHKNKCSVLVFNHERRQKINDKYVCIYTDNIINHLDHIVVERTFFHKHLRPISTTNIIYSDRMEVVASLYALTNRILKTKKYREARDFFYKDFTDVINNIEYEEHIALNRTEIINIIVKKYFLYLSKKKYLIRLIEEKNPKVILEVVSYNMDCMIVNEYAHLKKIPTIELQHGAIGRTFFAYNYPQHIKCINQLPSYLFTFSNSFVCHNHLPGVKCIEVGYPYLEQMYRIYPPQKLHNDILIIGQTTTALPLIHFAIELSKLCNQNIYFKLHPSDIYDWRTRYPNLASSNIQVIDSLDVSLYDLLSHSGYVVGTSSTCLYEALVYPVSIYLLKSYDNIYLEDLIERRCVTVIENANEFLCDFEKQKEKKNHYFWPKNSLEKIVKEIDNIIEQNENYF